VKLKALLQIIPLANPEKVVREIVAQILIVVEGHFSLTSFLAE